MVTVASNGELEVDNQRIVGSHNKIKGHHNVIVGDHNRVTGNGNSFFGDHNSAQGSGNSADGQHNRMNTNESGLGFYCGFFVFVGISAVAGIIPGAFVGMLVSFVVDRIVAAVAALSDVAAMPIADLSLDNAIIHAGNDEPTDDPRRQCPICYLNKPCLSWQCGHVFCISCTSTLYQAGNATCSICRQRLERLQRVYF